MLAHDLLAHLGVLRHLNQQVPYTRLERVWAARQLENSLEQNVYRASVVGRRRRREGDVIALCAYSECPNNQLQRVSNRPCRNNSATAERTVVKYTAQGV